MTPLDAMALAIKETQRDAFVAQNGYLFLLLRIDDNSEENDWSFRTTTLSVDRLKQAIALAESSAAARDLRYYRVMAVVKSDNNPWAGRISVGRARNNDIVLPHASVSKLHAHFSETKTGLTLSDAGSRNGTHLSGVPVGADQPVEAKPGDEIAFGLISLKLMTAADLYDFVMARIC